MRLRRLPIVVAALGFMFLAVQAVTGQAPAVPQDLKPLLAKPVSEMRLVVTRYNADRQTLNANYAGPGGFNMPGGRGGGAPGGRGAAPGAAAAPGPVPVSAARLARLKRFDLDWQTASGAIPTAKLSTAAQADLTALKSAITRNLIQLEADSLELAQMAPALPFAPALVALIEARIRVDDVNSENAHGLLTDVRNQLTKIKAAPPVKMSAATAGPRRTPRSRSARPSPSGSASTTAMTPCSRGGWACRTRQIDKVLEDYAGFLREKVAEPAWRSRRRAWRRSRPPPRRNSHRSPI
jgi:hypothetical protein